MATLTLRYLWDDPFTAIIERPPIMILETPTGLQVTYTEPSTNANGAPLTDLASTRVEVTTQPNETPSVLSFPATSASGGGLITADIPLTIDLNTEVDVALAIFAMDLSGNDSVATILIHRIDRLPPGPIVFTTST